MRNDGFWLQKGGFGISITKNLVMKYLIDLLRKMLNCKHWRYLSTGIDKYMLEEVGLDYFQFSD